MSARVTVLVDDEAEAGLRAEHGLSLWVEAGGLRILFDAGQGGALAHNARRLGIPIERTDALVVSHGHYDHTGGIGAVRDAAPGARVVLHPGSLVERYSVSPGWPPRAIGMPPAARGAVARLPAGAVVKVLAPLRLAETIGVTGPVPRAAGLEDVGGPFYLDPRGERKDPLEDDQALWVETPEGLIVCVGCSHAGLINTLTYAMEASGIRRIRAVVGGFHLHSAGGPRLEWTRDALRALAPGMLAPCHCTGAEAVRSLRGALGARVVTCRAGDRFLFGADAPARG